MSIFANILSVFGCQTAEDEVLLTPSGTVFYETISLPDGPGVQQIQDIIGLLPELSFKDGPWIAGGAARRLFKGEEIAGGDVDLFFKTEKSWKQFCDALEGYELVVKTQRAKTFRVNGIQVQCIHRRYYLTLEELFQDFDFSVCQIATDGNMLACTKQAELDIKDNILRPAPGGKIAKRSLIQRMVKYTGYGFIPEPGFFELVVKGGLDYVGAHAIFEGNDVAIYDEDEGTCVEETIPAEELDAGVMRTIARQLGLETNV